MYGYADDIRFSGAANQIQFPIDHNTGFAQYEWMECVFCPLIPVL